MTDQDPRNPQGLAWADLVGKYLLVGITTENMRGEVVRQEQFHGRVAESDPSRGLLLHLEGPIKGETYSLPPDLRSLRPAKPGEYRLRSTGEIVVDPDFTATWTVVQPDA